MITDIRFACGRCGQDMVTDSTAAGLSVNCPGCERPVIVPEHRADRLHIERTPERLRGSLSPDAEAEWIQLREELAAARAECERATAANTLAQAELKTFQAERLTMKNDLAQTRQRLNAAETQLLRQHESLRDAHALAEELGTECDALRLTLTAVKSQVDAIQTQLIVKESSVADLQTQLADRDNRNAIAEQEIAALRDESTLLRGHLDAAQNGLVQLDGLHAQLEQAEGNWLRTMEELQLARDESRNLRQRCEQLDAETVTLRADLNETEDGRELIRLRSTLQGLEQEQQRIVIENKELVEDFQRAASERETLINILAATRDQLGDAERRAEAVSDERLNQDNRALRGIILRQNDELEQRRVHLIRLKRVRLFIHLVYALLALGFVVLAIVLAALLPTLSL